MTTRIPPQPANWSRLGAVVHLEHPDRPDIPITTHDEFVVLTPRDTPSGTFSGIGHVHPLEHIPPGRYHLAVALDGVPTARIAVDMAEVQPPDTITVTVTMTLTVVPAVDTDLAPTATASPTDPLP